MVANRSRAKTARELEVVDAPIESLRPWPRNPRRITPRRLAQLQAMLVAAPKMLRARPLIALPDGTVIAGNQRLAAIQTLGWETVPVVYADLDERTAIEWALRDNQPLGESIEDLTAELLAELDAGGADLLLTGFAPDESAALLARLMRRTADPDAVPDPPPEPKSRRGEVYELGPHRLMCGDATDPADVERLMDSDSAALAFTSPPYLDLRDYGGDVDLSVAHLATFLDAWAPFCDLIAVNLGLVIRDGEIIRYWDEYLAAAARADLKLLAWNVWNREDATSMAAQRMMFPFWHEWVFVFGQRPRDAHRTLPAKHAGALTALGQRQVDGSMAPTRTYPVASHKRLGSVLTSPSHKGKSVGDHPAVFPVALPSSYLTSVTDDGDAIADPFSGSGTTLIAAEMHGRRCFAMELEPRYCDVTRQRYADYVGDQRFAP